jgi:hypothetical protein
MEKIGSRTGINPPYQQHRLLGCYTKRRKTDRERERSKDDRKEAWSLPFKSARGRLAISMLLTAENE